MNLALPRSFHSKIHLCPPGESYRVGQVWKMKTDDWPEGRQRPGRTALYKWLNSLFAAPLLTRGNAHTLSLQLCISAFLLSQLNFLYVLSYFLFDAVSLIINFVPTFTVSASVINAFFTGCKDSGENYLPASSPCWFLWLGFLVLIPGFPKINSWAGN